MINNSIIFEKLKWDLFDKEHFLYKCYDIKLMFLMKMYIILH